MAEIEPVIKSLILEDDSDTGESDIEHCFFFRSLVPEFLDVLTHSSNDEPDEEYWGLTQLLISLMCVKALLHDSLMSTYSKPAFSKDLASCDADPVEKAAYTAWLATHTISFPQASISLTVAVTLTRTLPEPL